MHYSNTGCFQKENHHVLNELIHIDTTFIEIEIKMIVQYKLEGKH